MRVLGRTLLVLALVLATIGLVFELGRRTTPPITDAAGAPVQGSLASLEAVTIGGDEQWVLLRGHDTSNPVLLFLHGGPGMPAMYLAHDFQRQLERDFVVVHWDRRAAGKSYGAGADSSLLTMSQTLAETFEVTEWLRARFGQDRLYLVGHSWGSRLGMLAAQQRPDLYAAFVGMGQMAAGSDRVEEHRRTHLLDAARSAGDQDLLDRLQAGQPATEGDLFRYGGELRGATSFWPILRTGLRAPEYGLVDIVNVGRGASRVGQLMKEDVATGPLEESVHSLAVPVFFFLGRHDLNTPSPLAAEYLAKLDAPLKRLVWFEQSAHFPFWTEADLFYEQMREVERVSSVYWDAHASSGVGEPVSE